MPAWLSPRVRLGVTASLIVLIACGLLLTPHLFHDDDVDAPGFPTSVNASIDIPPVPPPPLPVLPRQVLGLPTFGRFVPPPPSHNPSVGIGTDYGNASDSDSPETPDDPPDWLGQNSLAELGIAMPLSTCVDCTDPRPHYSPLAQQPILLLAGRNAGGGGGGGGGFASGGGSSAPASDTSSPSTPGSGPGDQSVSTPPDDRGNPEGPNPPGNPPGQPIGPTGPNEPKGPEGPGDPTEPTDPTDPDNPDGPGPQPPDVVQVPEPSSLIMAGAGALGFMIRTRISRKRRG